MRPSVCETDICLVLEGSYPYALGGVASWTHELIQTHHHLTFSLVAIVSAQSPAVFAYELPDNVKQVQTLRLQQLPKGIASLPARQEKALFSRLQAPLTRLQSQAKLDDLAALIEALRPYRGRLGARVLLDSPAAWELLLSMYEKTMPKTSFLEYFWSWRGLFGGLYSILLSPLPKAKAYHALCTGYAGLFAARAHLETGRACALTEHGIYTNERRIEIASADWLDDPHSFNLAVDSAQSRELKDFWIDTFGNYSRLCYAACDKIITLYEGNQEFQRMDGADPAKLTVIPNGIDEKRYGTIARMPHPPTVALIGRVVPIKDIKTFIKAIALLKEMIPDVHALVMGPFDEDPAYAQECVEMVEHLNMQEIFIFTGKVKVEDYFPTIDVLVLTSISEAQPLVILEGGIAGIPTVATDVGACREMILGGSHEQPKLPPGGAIVPLANARAVAEALQRILLDEAYRQQCSEAISMRVRRYYSKAAQYAAYRALYNELIGCTSGSEQVKAA